MIFLLRLHTRCCLVRTRMFLIFVFLLACLLLCVFLCSCVSFQALRLDYLVQKVRPILTKLMSSGTGPQRGLFNVPVDPQKLGIPDYFKRVPEPMDLVSHWSANLGASYASVLG